MSQTFPKSPKDYTILVVDDEELLREAVSFDFRRKGYTVLNAGCGNDAIEVLNKNKVDVVISDVRMPNGNGIELLDHIKKKNVFLPVVMFMTGFADISMEEAYDRGADAVFPKPFDRKALQEAVLSAIQPPEVRFNRKCVRVDVALEGDIQVTGTSNKVTVKITNVGRGGFFAELTPSPPNVGDHVEFVIRSSTHEGVEMSGQGVVRWLRLTSQDPDLPAGYGVEFVQLQEDSRRYFISLINAAKTKAFIPLK